MLMVMEHQDAQSQRGFTFIEGLLVVILVGIVGFAGWYVYDSNNKANNTYDASASMQNSISYDKKANGKNSDEKESSNSHVSDSLKENIADGIKSGNTAALEGYMADSVTVVIAASEKGGAETPAQAIKDLDYLKSATAPWDFALSSEVLKTYANGFYGKYFGENTVVGKSADGKVVAFGINDVGKIDTIFMASNADSLTQ